MFFHSEEDILLQKTSFKLIFKAQGYMPMLKLAVLFSSHHGMKHLTLIFRGTWESEVRGTWERDDRGTWERDARGTWERGRCQRHVGERCQRHMGERHMGERC